MNRGRDLERFCAGTLAVAGKELAVAFASSVAYLAAAFFLVVTSVWFFFVVDFGARDVASFRAYFDVMPLVLAFVVPALTMRVWAEERRSGSDELLLTLPLPDWSLVAGKYVAGLVLLTGVLALTIALPLTLLPLGRFERGEVVTQYLGMLLLTSAVLSIGQAVSARSSNQVSAFLSTVAGLLALVFVDSAIPLFGMDRVPAAVLRYVSIRRHFQGFNRGLVDTRDVVYFGLVTAAGLWATVRSLKRHRRPS